LPVSIQVSGALPLSRHDEIETQFIPAGNHIKQEGSEKGLKFLPWRQGFDE